MSDASELYAQQISAALPSVAWEPGRPSDVTDGRRGSAAMAATIDSAPPPGGAVQVVRDVPILWNWAPTAAGMMDRALFDFCDTIPLSDVHGAPFFSGSESFSGNYRAFVQAIDTPGAFGPTIRDAVARIAEPAENAFTTPPGWARVAVNGINEWRPVWSPQLSPHEWITAVAESDPAPRTIRFDFSDAETVPRPPLDAPWLSLESIAGSSVRRISITAKAWGRIAVAPGDWFNAALVSLAAQGVSFPPWTPELLFGPRGLLRSRISEFFVAYAPEVSMTVSNEVAEKVTDLIAGAARFVVGGMAFSGGAPSVPAPLQPDVAQTGGGTKIVARSSSSAPQIVAVVVTRPVAAARHSATSAA